MNAIEKYEVASTAFEQGLMSIDDFEKEIAPLRDVAPVMHSRWVLGGYDDMYYICEKCGHKQSEYYVKPTANFCPNCGAKMDAQGEE